MEKTTTPKTQERRRRNEMENVRQIPENVRLRQVRKQAKVLRRKAAAQKKANKDLLDKIHALANNDLSNQPASVMAV